ncbi:MAG: hypothetical protein WDN06_17355 [Asticcacaulis sp.]
MTTNTQPKTAGATLEMLPLKVLCNELNVDPAQDYMLMNSADFMPGVPSSDFVTSAWAFVAGFGEKIRGTIVFDRVQPVDLEPARRRAI